MPEICVTCCKSLRYVRTVLGGLLLGGCLLIASSIADPPADGPLAGEPSNVPTSKAASGDQRELFTGKVVLLKEALDRRDVRVAEEMAGQAVLETPDGQLIPLLADWRGRAFFQDEHLRDRKVELVGFRRPGLPYLQVLMVFTFDEHGTRQYTDYWCDICSIPMYEIKPCECCQGDIHLRFQEQELPDYVEREPSGRESPASDQE